MVGVGTGTGTGVGVGVGTGVGVGVGVGVVPSPMSPYAIQVFVSIFKTVTFPYCSSIAVPEDGSPNCPVNTSESFDFTITPE